MATEDLHSHPNQYYELTVQATDEYNPNAPPQKFVINIEGK